MLRYKVKTELPKIFCFWCSYQIYLSLTPWRGTAHEDFTFSSLWCILSFLRPELRKFLSKILFVCCYDWSNTFQVCFLKGASGRFSLCQSVNCKKRVWMIWLWLWHIWPTCSDLNISWLSIYESRFCCLPHNGINWSLLYIINWYWHFVDWTCCIDSGARRQEKPL